MASVHAGQSADMARILVRRECQLLLRPRMCLVRTFGRARRTDVRPKTRGGVIRLVAQQPSSWGPVAEPDLVAPR